jgi:hypothetical protein
MAQFESIKFQPQRPLLRELSADRLNTILTEIRRNKPKGERGITVRQSGDGTYIGLAATLAGGGGGAQNTAHPFQITTKTLPESNPENPTYVATVRPGTINSILPTGIFDGSGLKEHSISSDSLQYVVLEAESNGEQITSAEVVVRSSAATAQGPTIFGLPTGAEFLLGIVYNSSVYQVVKTVITVTGKQQFVTSKSSAGPGELPYNIHYVWG